MAAETLCWRDFLNTVSTMTAEELTEDALHCLVKRLTIDSALLADEGTGVARASDSASAT